MADPLPLRPDPENLRKRAKALLKRVRAGDPETLARVAELHPDFPDAAAGGRALAGFALADAQLVLARGHGFPSWKKMITDIAKSRAEPAPATDLDGPHFLFPQSEAIGQLFVRPHRPDRLAYRWQGTGQPLGEARGRIAIVPGSEYFLDLAAAGADLAWTDGVPPLALHGLCVHRHPVPEGRAGRVFRLRGLRFLYILESNFDDTAARGLGDLAGLEKASFWGSALGDGGLAELGRIPALRDLELAKTRITDAGLAVLGARAGLERLVLDSTTVGGEGLARLAGLTGLRELQLGNCPAMDDASLARLPELPALAFLTLMHTRVTDAGMATLGRFPALENLELFGTSVGDGGLAALPLERLRSLNLNGARITDAGLAQVAGRAERLERLILNSPPNLPGAITARGLAPLTRLPSLTTLRLPAGGLGDEAIPALAGLGHLRQLVIKGTSISEEGGARLREALPDCRIE